MARLMSGFRPSAYGYDTRWAMTEVMEEAHESAQLAA